MAAEMFVLGIEGTSYVGKSTAAVGLLEQLQSHAIIVPEYMQFRFPGSEFPPAQPQSKSQQLEAVRFFCGIERNRLRLAEQQATGAGILLLDRTLDTILAHIYALNRWDDAFLEECGNLIEVETAGTTRPALTLFLTAPAETVVSRIPAHQRRPGLFSDAKFINRFNEYFRCVRRPIWPCEAIDASRDATQVLEDCVSRLRYYLPEWRDVIKNVSPSGIIQQLYNFDLST